MTSMPAKPLSQSSASRATMGLNTIRDQLSLPTWLLVGATLQSTLLLLPGVSTQPLSLFVFTLLAAKISHTAFRVWTKSYESEQAKIGKYAVRFDGSRDGQGVCVLNLGFRSNHPLGIFAPGVKQMGEYTALMNQDLHDNAVSYGFLGHTSYIGASDSSNSNELMSHYYFSSVEGLHKFAHEEAHRKGWLYWLEIAKDHPYMAIMHETYSVAPGNWEAIYINYKPSGIGAVTLPGEDGEWVSPLVEAKKGKNRTMWGRMGKTTGEDHDSYKDSDPYN